MIGGPGVGTAENGNVTEISMVNDGFTYPSVSENIMVSIENDGATYFTITIKNLEGSTTPVAPGVWVVHSTDNPLFEVGLAEDGNPSGLAGQLDMNSGYVSPLAPGA